jgi:hypothetical protein
MWAVNGEERVVILEESQTGLIEIEAIRIEGGSPLEISLLHRQVHLEHFSNGIQISGW